MKTTQKKSYEKILGSFLHHLTIVRNISAHHSRLWNKKIPLDFTLPKNPQILNDKLNPDSKKYLFNTMILTNYILNIIDDNNDWIERILKLIETYNIDKQRMGFKENI